MPDVFSKEKRSEVMARIRSHGNATTEKRLAEVLRAARLSGWRRQIVIKRDGTRGVRPDFVFRRERVAVFVDGCYWHGCPVHGTRPKQNRRFWDAKIARNKERDAEVTRALRRAGWKVVRIWEHALKAGQDAAVARRIRKALGCA